MRKSTVVAFVAQLAFAMDANSCFANVKPTDFDSLFPTSPGLSVARFPLQIEGLSKFGFISVGGKLVIPCKYEQATSFSGGFAAVKQGGRWGLIDQSGAVIVAPHYSYLQ